MEISAFLTLEYYENMKILQKYHLQRGNICFLQFATHDWSNSIILLLLKSFSTRFTRRTTEEKGNLHFSLAADVELVRAINCYPFME